MTIKHKDGKPRKQIKAKRVVINNNVRKLQKAARNRAW